MAQTNKLDVPITGGIRQDLSEHMAPPGTLVDATNVRFSTQGEVESRPGTTALSAATDADTTLAEIWNGTSLLDSVPGGFVVGSAGFSYRYDFAKARLHVAGSYANAEPIKIFDVMAREQIAAVGGSPPLVPAPLSQAAINGYVATVYSCGNGQGSFGPGDNVVVLHVFTESGTLVMSAALTSTSKAWLVRDGSSTTNLILVTQDTTTGLTGRIITTSATGATLGGSTSLGTLNANADYWAACYNVGVGWALVYQSAAAVMTIKTVTGVTVAATQTFAITAASSPVSIYADGTNIYVGWRDGAGAPYAAIVRIYNNALVAGATTTVYTEVVGVFIGPPLFGPSLANVGGAATYVVSRGASYATGVTSWIIVGDITNTGVNTQLHQLYQCTAESQPFGPGYLWVRAGGFNSQNQSAFERMLLLDFMALRCPTPARREEWQPVIALTRELFIGGPQSSWAATFYRQFVSTPAVLTDGSLVMGIPRLVRSDTPSGGLALAEWLHFSIGGTRQTTRYGDGLIVSGFPTLTEVERGTRDYDGTNTLATQDLGTDLGFPLPPSIQVVASNGAGGLTSGGTYSWRAVVERIDSFGRRWRSAPSDVDTEQLGAADDTATVTCELGAVWFRATELNATNASQFVMHVYRTTAGGSTFYRTTPAQGAPWSLTTGEWSYTDLTLDVDLQERETLYTDGGVLPNDCPPSCRFIRATEDRIWLAGLWEEEQLQSSKIIVPGEPPQFSDSPAFRVVLSEPCTGIAYQDGTLIAFTRSAIYAIQGTGPNDQGQGAWDSPRCVTRSSGCINELSIVETSVGVFYQSIRGIELLPRGLGEPQFPGVQVQDSLALLPVQAASVVSTSKDRTVRFCYGATVAGSQNVLVYDLDTQCWSRDSYPLSISGICDTDSGAVLATVDPDADAGYGWLLESDSIATDQANTNAYEIASTLTWAKVRPFGVAGMGRFSAAIGLFDAETPGYRSGNATITLAVDLTVEPGFTFNMNTLSGASYRKVAPRIAEGTAGKLTLATLAAGWRFMGWTIELDELGGGHRMGETEQG